MPGFYTATNQPAGRAPGGHRSASSGARQSQYPAEVEPARALLLVSFVIPPDHRALTILTNRAVEAEQVTASTVAERNETGWQPRIGIVPLLEVDADDIPLGRVPRSEHCRCPPGPARCRRTPAGTTDSCQGTESPAPARRPRARRVSRTWGRARRPSSGPGSETGRQSAGTRGVGLSTSSRWAVVRHAPAARSSHQVHTGTARLRTRYVSRGSSAWPALDWVSLMRQCRGRTTAAG